MLIETIAVSTNRAVRSDNLCNAWINLAGSGPLVVAFTVDLLLMMRVYAVYNRSKLLLVILLLLYTASFSVSTAYAVISVHEITAVPKPPSLPFPGCTTTPSQIFDKTIIAWAVALINQTVLFALILYKYILSIRTFATVGTANNSDAKASGGILGTFRQTRKLLPLLSLFLRDGTFAFLAIVAIVMLNLIFSADDALNSGPIQQMGTPWLFAAESVLASRLVLDLGGYIGATPVVNTSSWVGGPHTYDDSTALSTLHFTSQSDRPGQSTSMNAGRPNGDEQEPERQAESISEALHEQV